MEERSDCWFYSLGGNSSRGFASYPVELGPRCEKKKKFFTEVINCSDCSDFKRVRDARSC